MNNSIIEEDIRNILSESLPYSSLEGSTFMVTGAYGFIGSYIVRTLLQIKNTKVVAVVRNELKAKDKFSDLLNNSNFSIFVQDLNIPFDFDEHVDYIIHAASQASPKYYGVDPVGTLKTNSIGTSSLLDIAVKNKVKKFIFISSGEVYGKIDDNTPELIETYTGNVDITDVRSCYGESKRIGENMCVCYSHQYGIPVNMLRLSHIYGPAFALDDGRCVPDFVSNVISNKNIVLNSDGSAKRCFCYITDFIRALFYVLFYGKDKNAYNVAADKETSILELAETLTKIYPEKNLHVEFNKDVFSKGYIKSASSRSNFNTDKIKELGWSCKTDIKTGLKRMVESYGV